MKTRTRCLAAAIIVCAAAAAVWAIGTERKPGIPVENPIVSLRGRPRQPIWPQGLVDVANSRPYVHGYEVNFTPYLFYTGDTVAFNDFVNRYAAVSGVRHEVVLRIGPKKARSPWDKADRNIDVNWAINLPSAMDAADAAPGAPLPAPIDLWLGGPIDLTKLDLPANVTARSGGEIEKFIAARGKVGG